MLQARVPTPSSTFQPEPGQDAALAVHARNNLFRGCPAVNLNAAPGTAWEWFDNLFDTTTLWQYFGGVANGYNAYHNCPRQLTPAGSGHLILTALSYATDAWGRRGYAMATPPLADAGSRTAGAAGLGHYPTRPDQVQEGATAVDIGFHLVAAEPAEAEIAVNGAALSASSSYYNGQWNPARARDGLLSDPGWHNSGYTQPVEFLRADLGVSRPVGGVGYVPRVMSPSWTDGTWNGVYRRWEIYVTDSAGNDPADWGGPVAAGEWSWPNGQERKEVRFAARSGRYGIWRRVEAWGWYTRQAGQSWPGYANANEVWVYPPPPAALSPVDTDGDGLADWGEDANGDGSRQPEETDLANGDTDGDGLDDKGELQLGTNPIHSDTDHDGIRDSDEIPRGFDPLHPDSDLDGWPDGAELAESVELFPYSYSLAAVRDFTTPLRDPDLPDATVIMNWGNTAAAVMEATGNMAECYPTDPPPPPETVKTEGIEYRWLPAGNGTSRRWKTTFGNSAKQYDPVETSERPPSAMLGLPLERCVDFVANRTDPPFTGTFTRTASTIMHLRSIAPTWPKPQRSVVLTCNPWNLTMYNEPMLTLTAWSTGYGLGEPNTWPCETMSIDPAITPIVIDGLHTNPDGSVRVEVSKAGEKPVTPDVQDPTIRWYRYGLSQGPIKPVTLTWSAHHLIPGSLPDLQAAFDDGETDDVPCHLEFFILQAWYSDWQSTPAADPRFNLITKWADLRWLCTRRMSNIKLVTNIKIPLPPPLEYWQPGGYAEPYIAGLILVVGKINPTTVLHEYGHICGLQHRTNYFQTEAIMYVGEEGVMPGGTEVNMTEANAIWTFRPPAWSE